MNRRQLPALVLPLVAALIFVSLPEAYNHKIRNSLSQQALGIKRLFTKPKHAPHGLEDPLKTFFKQKERALLEAEKSAGSLTPFFTIDPKEEPEYLVAEVLFRIPSKFNSLVWVNKGSLHSPLIKKNSPVLAGDSLVGVIDYVGPKASCVRLITDSGLCPAVRVQRGAIDRGLFFALSQLQEAVDDGAFHFKDDEEKTKLLWTLHHLKEQLKPQGSTLFLAKGILQGCSQPHLLKGSGFNYDFKDQHGPSRDLRTGEIVQVGDLLVTSGLDGVFPEGLKVAKVHKIMPLQEGAYAYELLAEPTAQDLQNLDFVTILQPQDFSADELPKEVDLILNQLSEQ